MILVTGATGTIGSEVVRQLVTRGEQVRAVTRDPERAAVVLDPAGTQGVEIVRGDDAGAFAGVKAVLMLSAPGPWLVEQDAAVMESVRRSKARRVVKVSAIGADEEANATVGVWHVPGERALRESDLEWTIVRPSSFASNVLRWAPAIAAGRPIPNTMGPGQQGVVDPRDVAEVIVVALTGGDHARQVHTLTGPELLSVPEMAVRLGDVLGRPVGVVDLPLDEYRTQLLDAGLAPEFADAAVNGSRLVAEGGNARLTGDVEAVLGRPPRTFESWAHDHRTAFSG